MSNVQMPYSDSELESFPAINQRIMKTFGVLGKVADGIVSGALNCILVSGAAGVGKSFTLESKFGQAESEGQIEYNHVKGVASAIGVYKLLFDHKEENGVLVLDDCDNIFFDMDTLNLLKAALDTGKSRRVSWNKESKILDGEGVDRTFEFNGSVVFITNIDFDREIAKDSKFAAHYKALLSRCMYVDMGIHTRKEIFVRLTQVALEPFFLRENNLTVSQAQEMVGWVRKNMDVVRELSIRTMIHLARIRRLDADWQDTAETLLISNKRRLQQKLAEQAAQTIADYS